jgi:hypothetical protein
MDFKTVVVQIVFVLMLILMFYRLYLAAVQSNTFLPTVF